MIPLGLFLLACAAVYLATIETAFGATLQLSLRLVADRDDDGGTLQRYLEDPVLLYVPSRLLLAADLVLATLAVSALWTGTTAPSAGGVLLAMAAYVLVCVYVLPVVLVRRDPDRVLAMLLPPFDVAARLLSPLTRPLIALAAATRERRAAGLNGDSAAETEPPGSGATDDDGGLMEGDERRLLKSIVDFGDTLVREVMTPRPDVVAIVSTATLDELRTLVREEQYSRIPVFRESLDDIVGVAFVKDLIRNPPPEADGAGAAVTMLMRPATFVPETKRVPELLREFQLQQVQMAIVVDEYGGTAGLVTLEDLIEEIVGEIRDEYDVEAEPVVEEREGVFLVSGGADVDEMAERLGVRIERDGFETVGGYLQACLGRVPTAGESFERDGLVLEVLEAEGRRVTKVRVQRQDVEPETPVSSP